ncbi:NAD(P)H-hydrate dehydratase [Pullulanibacillus sp. KACC 23026]|uniref:NAD(P)H-hydrate dehydratase n=1 Tax=Pullulanibacillus sp. KACC 23026 TaxID=3028315 RepID=UPI0023B18345|nr:NAD(P)H-hydrate dehydratase [Pullulanibacillus sp. KACC 23026]WEG12921.1 NAD(P)H-hydrate dehydratase [Pullulanibacillus sp. KACC 23026]
MFIYRSDEIKEIDRDAEAKGMAPFTLMEVAGHGLFLKIANVIHKSEPVLVLAGKGNNGGDAIVLARYLNNQGYKADLAFPLGPPKTETAKRHLDYYEASGYHVVPWTPEIKVSGWLIDGLLGVGAKLPLREEIALVTLWMNQQQAAIIAIDLPTGVDSDTGMYDPNSVKAAYTFSLHGYKPSAFLQSASEQFGSCECVDIGLKPTSRWQVWTKEAVRATRPDRREDSHKGTYGTGLLVAGQDDMPGSAALAAIGALRFGIGKLSVSTTRHASLIIGQLAPEATFIYEPLESDHLDVYSAIAIGPGRDLDEGLETLIAKALQTEKPVILDAGALQKRDYPKRKAPTIVTPHPGEFARMTGYSIKSIQSNRLELAKAYAMANQVVVVLKGQYTVVAFPDGSGLVNPTGNPSLAKGGSGDTLTGLLLASLSFYSNLKAGVANAVYIHGLCSDEWIKENGETALVAHDFASLLPKVLKKFDI